MDAQRHEPPLTVPSELEREHLAEARRVVARSHRRPLVRSRRAASAPVSPQAKARRAAFAAHGFALLLVVVLATVSGAWGIAAAMAGVSVVSLIVVLRIIAALTTDTLRIGAPTRLRTDRSG